MDHICCAPGANLCGGVGANSIVCCPASDSCYPVPADHYYDADTICCASCTCTCESSYPSRTHAMMVSHTCTAGPASDGSAALMHASDSSCVEQPCPHQRIRSLTCVVQVRPGLPD